ncbi:MAG TPA: cell division protein ZapA [Elusimicrobiota bacterium]|jgi:cell division protein ZapA (FtsZ GTPase activity inhibitor)|nr:cell division protein ZapA [Elusimicrobiota bacterium]
MLNEKVDIEVGGRRLTVEMEGLTELEISNLARMVHQRMEDIRAHNSKVVDTQKLAILTALELAADVQRLKAQLEEISGVEERRLDKMLVSLENALDASPEKP